MSIILQAVKQNLLFKSAKGQVALTDLMVLPLTNLRKMANAINRELKGSDDLFAVVAPENKLDKLRLSVLVAVIEFRENEAKTQATKEERASERKVLKELIAKKKLEAKEGSSLEDLEKLLSEISED